MTAVLAPAIAAARTVLTARRDRQIQNLPLVESAGWLLGAAGEELPVLGDPVEEVHSRLAAAAGAADIPGVEALLAAHLPLADGTELLVSACYLIGPFWPDLLVSIAHRHPGRNFAGRLLANTTHPSRLMALLPDEPRASHTVVTTIGELVIAGRDRAAPLEAAELRWAEIVAQSPNYLDAYRDTLLRITVRASLEEAVTILGQFGAEWGRDLIGEGATAVLARLVRVDPGQAFELATASEVPWHRAAWLEGLSWWGEVIPAAVPAIMELLEVGDTELGLAVARILAGTRNFDLLEQALGALAGAEKHGMAISLASGVRRARAAGRHEVAALVRERCLAALRSGAPPDDVSHAGDEFEVLAVPGPALVPWAVSPGLP